MLLQYFFSLIDPSLNINANSYQLLQDSHADAEGCSAQYIVTVISTNARLITKSLVLKKSGNLIP